MATSILEYYSILAYRERESKGYTSILAHYSILTYRERESKGYTSILAYYSILAYHLLSLSLLTMPSYA